jgi:hypothetical protein
MLLFWSEIILDNPSKEFIYNIPNPFILLFINLSYG